MLVRRPFCPKWFAMADHELALQSGKASGETMFQCRCSCGWISEWETTNAVMGRGRRHVAAMRRAETKAAQR